MDAPATKLTCKVSLRLLSVVLMLLTVTSVMSGCSDPKAPNRKNFTDAINRAIGDSIFVSLEEIPVSEFNGGHGGRRLSKLDQRFETGDHYLKTRKMLFNDRKKELLVSDLVEKGMLIPWMEGYYTGRGPFDAPVDVYLFKAAQVHHAQLARAGTTVFYQFYCGKPGVSKIVSWTEPGSSTGVTISSVTYQARLTDAPEWASSLRKYLDESLGGEKEAMLVLTPEGWRTR